MDLDRENSIPGQKNFQIQGNWTPVTPTKPSLQTPQPIYPNRYDNQQLGLEHWGRTEGCSTGLSRENQGNAEFVEANYFEVNRVNNLEEDFTGKDAVSSVNAGGNGQACIDPLNGWNNIPFVDLLTQAAMGSAPHGSVLAPSSPFDFGYYPQIGGSWPETAYASLCPSAQDLLVGSQPWTNSTFMPQITQCELPMTGRHDYDLNMLPGIITDELPSSSVPQFAPITLDKIKNQDNQNKNHVTTMVEIIELDQEQTLSQVADSSFPAVSTAITENQSPEKGNGQVIDLNTTPQQKPRKKKHRPKVIREDKSKKAQTPAGRMPDNLKENSTVKRKYVRKKGMEKATTTPPPSKVSAESSDPKQGQSAIKSIRRTLNFDLDVNPETQATMQNRQVNANEKVGTSEQISSKPEEHLVPISPNDSNCSATVTFADRQGTAKKRQCDPTLDMDDPRNVNLSGSQYSGLHQYETFKAGDFGEKTSGVYFPEICKKRRAEKGQTSTTSSTYSPRAKNVVNFVRERLQNQYNASILESKGNYCISASQLQTDRVPSTQAEVVQIAMDRVQAFESMLSLGDKEGLAKKRSKGPTRVCDLGSLIGIGERQLMQAFPGIQTLFCNEPQGADVSQSPQNCTKVVVTETSAKVAKRKSQKLKSLRSSVSSSINTTEMHQNSKDPWKHLLTIDDITERLKHLNINMKSNVISYQNCNGLIPYNRKKRSQNALVPYNRKNQSQDALVTYQIKKQEQNALVMYGRDGTLVPFEGPFYPIKKRRPRPKVDLDEESTKVWRLLLENINNEGIDGTDEQKVKWWEEERRVFCGRADSFIARMHLVQGDRRFSKWKGSVVDSVVGVFLTQNVSDHLSSSAFMSMAAHFPLKTNSNGEQHYNYGTNILEEPELCILDQDTIKWKENISLNLVCDRNSVALNDPGNNDEKEVVVNSHDSFGIETNYSKSRLGSFRSDLENFHESTTQHLEGGTSCVIGDRTAMEDVISSQSSVDSSTALIPERRLGQCSESNSESQDPTALPISTSFVSTTSFVKLLQIAGTPKLDRNHSHKSCLGEYDKSLVNTCNQPCGYDKQSQNLNRFDGPETSLVESITPSSNHHSVLTTNSRSPEVDCIECVEEESRSSEISCKKDESRMSDINKFTEESSSKATSQTKLAVGILELLIAPQDIVHSNSLFTTVANETEQTRCKPLGESEQVESLTQGKTKKFHQNKSPYFSGEISDVTESTSALKNRKNTEHKGAGPYSKEKNDSSVTVLNQTAVDTITVKRKRAGKDKVPDIDWDSLRKQAQANGPREKTASTMDSLDWEAVRCADVGEIAHTIRERGMNNMLAERIKAFLNRLVSEHGSLDLEWLRDVPPDKAKEYLLSIRGLGLKSVECIRLLTLHHLAFPVDTNVGRIAVRLGWVPLQPLPESLQLHLLELYPVLESIQKYLWPRLCKLDQRTLYELHYQMITFGKVFCTKSKPNCNACPMRGECRHFASAFASARLALPGPEEKGMVIATENRAAGDNPPIITNTLQLPPTPVDHHLVINTLLPPPPPVDHHSVGNNKLEENRPSEGKYGISNNEPIIEEPLTPEPEIIQILECDIEDAHIEDPDEIPTIKLNIEELTQNLQDYMQKNMELQDGDMSRALVALTPELASLPTPKLKYISRLRTEHQVYELPDSHPLLQGLDKREPDDPCSYLLAIWTPGETIDSIQPPEESCSFRENGKLCAETTCFSCNSKREANTQTVRGTLLIPCRTAMRGSFPLNGTYFQVNEVFADHDSSLNPIDVPRAWIWNLPRRTVYFGTSIPSIFKGLTTEGIQYCFWRGFVCVRGFDQKSRAPRPLIARLHFPASRLIRTTKSKTDDE